MEISKNALENIRQSFDCWRWFVPEKILSKYSETKPVNFFDRVQVWILSNKQIPNWVHKKSFDVLKSKDLKGWFGGKRGVFSFGHPEQLTPNKPQFMLAKKGDKTVVVVVDREAGKDEKGFVVAVFNHKTYEELIFSLKRTTVTSEPVWKTELVFE